MNPTVFTTDHSGQSRRVPVRLVKRLIKGGIAFVFAGLVVVLLCNLLVVITTRQQIYFNLKDLPTNDIGLVLGTSKFVRSGKENLFFRYRMEATARLYKEGKIKTIILSGNNDSEYYNEPSDMRRALLRLGVPDEAMIPDFAGFRTFDSVIRCKSVFGHEKITIISQNFHNARALYIGNHEGMQAIAFAAQDVPNGYSLRTLIREYLARPYAMLDVYILRPEPKQDNSERKKSEP